MGWEWRKALPDRMLISEGKGEEYKGNHSFREEKVEERAALIQRRWPVSLGVLQKISLSESVYFVQCSSALIAFPFIDAQMAF